MERYGVEAEALARAWLAEQQALEPATPRTTRRVRPRNGPEPDKVTPPKVDQADVAAPPVEHWSRPMLRRTGVRQVTGL